MRAALKEEGPAGSALRSAPANVQTAMKGLFTFESNLKTAITDASNITQLESSLVTPGQSPSLCGTTTTTTAVLP